MKKILLSLIPIVIATSVFGQSKKVEDAIWWEIAEKCFDETGLENHNTLFLGIDNEHSAGSIYKKRINSVGRMLHPILLFDYEQVASQMNNYPIALETTMKKIVSFPISNTKEHQTKLVDELLLESRINKACPEIYSILKSSVGNSLTFTKWGTVEFNKDDFENNLQENKKEDFAKETRNGERYVAIKCIWMQTIKLTFNIHKDQQENFNKLCSENKEKLSNTGITTEGNTLSITFEKKYYPFTIMGEITKIIGLKSFKGIVIEPDFNRYNNLIKYKPKN